MRGIIIVLFSFTTGCTAGLLGEGSASDKEADTTASKIEGSQIGQEGLVMRLGDRTITFHDWVQKSGTNNEYMGFSLTIDGADSLGYVVKAGTSRYASTARTWMHPDGDNANAISNVDVDDDGDGGDGGDGGGDGGDGCIEGCDDGDGGDGGDGGGDGGDGGDGGGDGGDGCIEGCDDNTGDGEPDRGFGDDGGGICFEPGGCDGAGGDSPPKTDGEGDDGGAVIL